MVLTKAYMIKEDFETARIYLDNGLQIAQQYELHDMICTPVSFIWKTISGSGFEEVFKTTRIFENGGCNVRKIV